MIKAQQLIETICAERAKATGTPPHLTRARLSLKVGIDLSNSEEFNRIPDIESKIITAATSLGITV